LRQNSVLFSTLSLTVIVLKILSGECRFKIVKNI